jgi:hypothetical protein
MRKVYLFYLWSAILWILIFVSDIVFRNYSSAVSSAVAAVALFQCYILEVKNYYYKTYGVE